MNKKIQDAVLGYTAKESQQNVLGEGTHTVRLVDWKPTHSFDEWNGNEKEELPQFSDPTPQLAVMFRNEQGVTWHRFNMWGYTRWNELSDEQQSDGKHEKVIFGETAYACKEANGKLVRIRHAKRTADAQSIVDQFMTAVNMVGKPVGELGAVIAGEVDLNIKIESRTYNDAKQLRITNFSKVDVLVESDEFSE